MTRRTHDADLCDRIKALEDKIAELERELEVHRAGSHGGTWWYPVYPYTPSPYVPNWAPTITWTSSDTIIGSTTSIDPTIPYTLTENS